MFNFAAYQEPHSLAAVQAILAEVPAAQLLAGGTDIFPKMHSGKLGGATLVSLQAIPELQELRLTDDGGLVIGSMVTFARLSESEPVGKRFPVLPAMASSMGGPQIRNMATIGGNLCNGAPSADSAPTLLALNAQLMLTGPGGQRQLPLTEFYRGPFQVNLHHGEILTSIVIPPTPPHPWGARYIKFSTRKAMDIATLGCAAYCRSSDGRHFDEIRIALGTAAPTPIRCFKAEETGQGREATAQLIADIGQAALQEASPRSSWRASRQYREHLIKNLSSRALTEAYQQVLAQFGEGTR